MRIPRVALAAIGIAVALGAAPMAQQQTGKAKKHPHQTPDRGVDDAAAPAVTKPTGDKNVAAAKVTVRANGVNVAELDESFEDAVVVTVNADGSRSYTCLHGLPLSAGHLAKATAPVTRTPVLEEK